MKKELSKAYIALGMVSFFWGTTYIASRIGVRYIPGFFVAGVRQFISGLILVSYFLLKGYSLPDRGTLKKIFIQGVFLLCIANGLLTWALEYISSGLAAIIAGLVPLFVALFSILLLKSAKLTRLMVIGLLVGFGGIVTIFYEYLYQLMKPGFAFGVVLAIVSTLSWSFGSVYSSRHKLPIDILFAVGIQMLMAGTVMLIICLLSGRYVNLFTTDQHAWYALLYLIIVGSLVTYSAYVFAISKLPATQVSLYAYINPIVAVALGWLILHEKISINVVTGTLITLGGVYLVNREFKKQQVQRSST